MTGDFFIVFTVAVFVETCYNIINIFVKKEMIYYVTGYYAEKTQQSLLCGR